MPATPAVAWSPELAAALATHSVELEGVVAVGGTAVVYRGRDRKHDRAVAVKVFRPLVADQLGADRFLREIQVAARLRHPHILPLLDSGRTAAGEIYYLMPLATGDTLRTRLAGGPLPLGDAIRIAREVGEALAHAHAAGFVHRDVKPENILIEEGHAVLADFGLAKRIQASDGASDATTRVGLLVGTPAYMSPEQLEAGALDGRSDVYSLGVTLYEMVTGTAPFGGSTTIATLARRFERTRLSARAHRTGVPAALDHLLRRALEPEVPKRLPSAAEFAAALALLERGRPTAAPRRVVGGLMALAAAGLLLALLIVPAFHSTAAIATGLSPRRIVVADMANESGDSALAPLGALAGDMIAAGLSSDARLDVLNAEFILGAPRQAIAADVAGTSPERLRALVDSTGAGTVISGSFYVSGRRVEFFAEVTDARTGRLVRAIGPIAAARSRLQPALEAVRDSVVSAVREALPADSSASGRT